MNICSILRIFKYKKVYLIMHTDYANAYQNAS